MKWFCHLLLGSETKFVRLKSWRPFWGRYGVEWPTMVIDRCGMRSTATPVWDRYHLRAMWYHLRGMRAPEL